MQEWNHQTTAPECTIPRCWRTQRCCQTMSCQGARHIAPEDQSLPVHQRAHKTTAGSGQKFLEIHKFYRFSERATVVTSFEVEFVCSPWWWAWATPSPVFNSVFLALFFPLPTTKPSGLSPCHFFVPSWPSFLEARAGGGVGFEATPGWTKRVGGVEWLGGRYKASWGEYERKIKEVSLNNFNIAK